MSVTNSQTSFFRVLLPKICRHFPQKIEILMRVSVSAAFILLQSAHFAREKMQEKPISHYPTSSQKYVGTFRRSLKF
jgi:hypothetical protein